jgi:hypothetical protein
MSLSNSTWKKYCSGWNAWLDFERFMEKKFELPLLIEDFCTFAIWCSSHRGLADHTIKSYMYSVSLAHAFKNLPCVEYNSDKMLKLILRGIKNDKDLCNPVYNSRRTITLPTLLLIGHRLSVSQWSKMSIQVIWTACSIGFFTSVRMGEILSANVAKFDSCSTLLWKHVKFLDNNEILMYIPSTKTSKCKGEFIDIFPFPDKSCCPVRTIKKLMALQLQQNIFDLEKPVFTFSSGQFLTTNKLNAVLKGLLNDIYVPGENSISCHSFRSALPSLLNTHPEIFSNAEIQSWGRWQGMSYLVYLKFHRANRRETFAKLVNVLYK